MIKKTDFFPRKWMSAETLTRSGAVYTIEKFDQEVFPARDGKPAATKPVLYFVEEAQGFVLNATNFDILFDAFGADERKWIGKRNIGCRKRGLGWFRLKWRSHELLCFLSLFGKLAGDTRIAMVIAVAERAQTCE